MKHIFVSHPFQNKKSNKESIAHIAQYLSKKSVLPISPVHSFSYLNDNIPEERAKAMEFCEEVLEMCDAVFFTGDWENSDGCMREWDAAMQLMKPVYIVKGWKDGEMVFEGSKPKWFMV